MVRDRDDLLYKVIPFSEKHPLQTEKRKDFEVFREVLRTMKAEEHLELAAFKKILQLAFSMNANGRYRKRKMEDILAKLKILRDCTLEILPQEVKIQSDLHGDVKTTVEIS